MEKAVNWSMTEPEKAHQNIKQLVCSMRGTKNLPTGSLVIVQTSEGKFHSNAPRDWTYARIAEKPEGSMILVYLDPEESKVSTFSIERVIPIPQSILDKYFKNEELGEVKRCFCENFLFTHIVVVVGALC